MMMVDPKDKEMAFVVIDLQKRFMTDQDDMETGFNRPIALTNRIADMFREAGRPVIFVKMVGGTDCRPYEGDDGEDFFDGVRTCPSDIIVEKHHMNSFRDTRLADVIKENGCDCALFAGTVTQYCVISTYYSAFDYDIVPYLAEGACIAAGQEKNDAAYTIAKTMVPAEIETYLESHRRV